MKVVNSKVEQEPVKFEDLETGQCFKWSKDTAYVWMKTDYEQDAVDLRDGQYVTNCCGEDVFPVDAEVHIIN